MKRLRLAGVVLCVAAAVGACSGDHPAAEVSAAPAAGSPVSTTPVRDSVLQTCRAFMGDGGPASLLSRVPDALLLLGAVNDPADTDRMRTLDSELQVLIGRAEAGPASQLGVIRLPFQQYVQALRDGGGVTKLNTAAARDGVFNLIDTCSNAGYKVSG